MYAQTFLPNSQNLPSRARGSDQPVLGIVIHSMAEWLTHNNEKLWAPDFLTRVGLSAHAFIDMDGTQIFGVPLDRIAYHAGLSKIGNHSNLNNQWLGIEVLVKGHHNWASFRQAIMEGDPFTEEQYRSTATVCRDWMGECPFIQKELIVGHNEVSGPEVRPDPKIDPGRAWDWDQFWRWFDLLEDPVETKKIDPPNIT